MEDKIEIDYVKLLDKWSDKIIQEAERMDAIMEKEDIYKGWYLVPEPTNKYLQAQEFRNGLYYALAMLNRLENKEKRRLKDE